MVYAGRPVPKPYKRVWVSAYCDEKNEYYDLVTVDENQEDESRVLWHREFPLGIGTADFLYVDLSAMQGHIAQMKKIGKDEWFLYDCSMFWMRQSPLLFPFAAAIQRLHLGGTIAELEKLAAYYVELQPILKRLANECFEQETALDMVALYLNRQSQFGKEIYPELTYGPLTLRTAVMGTSLPCAFDNLADLLLANKGKTKDFVRLGAREVLSSESAEDLVHFILSRYLQANLRFRVCKFCGRYFGITGNTSVEYCSRLIDGSTKTCKEQGSFKLYEKRTMENPAVREYKRSYKAHNARIRYGSMSREEFNEWSREARQRRDDCIAGKISLEDFVEWLDSDRARN